MGSGFLSEQTGVSAQLGSGDGFFSKRIPRDLAARIFHDLTLRDLVSRTLRNRIHSPIIKPLVTSHRPFENLNMNTEHIEPSSLTP